MEVLCLCLDMCAGKGSLANKTRKTEKMDVVSGIWALEFVVGGDEVKKERFVPGKGEKVSIYRCGWGQRAAFSTSELFNCVDCRYCHTAGISNKLNRIDGGAGKGGISSMC